MIAGLRWSEAAGWLVMLAWCFGAAFAAFDHIDPTLFMCASAGLCVLGWAASHMAERASAKTWDHAKPESCLRRMYGEDRDE